MINRMPAHHELAFEAVEFTISFPSSISRFVVPSEVANLFKGHTLFHFEIESGTGEQIFEGTRAIQSDGFDLGRTVDADNAIFVRMGVETL